MKAWFTNKHGKVVLNEAALLFFKACTKGYVVISYLTPPLNTDIVKQ